MRARTVRGRVVLEVPQQDGVVLAHRHHEVGVDRVRRHRPQLAVAVALRAQKNTYIN